MAMKHPQEYEVMRKESSACSDIGVSSIICPNPSPLPDPSTLAPLLASNKENGVSDVTHLEDQHEQKDSIHQLTRSPGSGTKAVDEQGAVAQGMCRYEYMDIRRASSAEEDNPAKKTHATCAGEAEDSYQTVAELKEDLREVEKDEEDKRDTDEEHPLQMNQSSELVDEPDVLQIGDEKIEEYEEMTIQCVVPIEWEQADYQNIPAKGRTRPEDAGSSRCGDIGEYIKVCAGIREPGGNTSFDNPDYWQSRLFLQPDAVRT